MIWPFKKKAEEIFIIVVIGRKAYDYPQDMPLPRVGERVSIENATGVVIDVIHSQYGTFREVKIDTK